MRTTVTLEKEVELLLRKAMREQGLSFKDALNMAIREGAPHLQKRSAGRVRLPSYTMGAPRVDLTKALGLADALEDEAIIRKLKQGR